MNNYVIGIDPGKNGGIALMNTATHKIEGVFKIPDTPADLLELLQGFPRDGCVAYLEQVHEQPGQRGMFEFGRNYGMIETSLTASKISHYKVTPQKWQKGFQLRKPETTDKTKAYSQRKAILKAKAQEIFPEFKVTLGNADALLLAEYAYQQEKITLQTHESNAKLP